MVRESTMMRMKAPVLVKVVTGPWRSSWMMSLGRVGVRIGR